MAFYKTEEAENPTVRYKTVTLDEQPVEFTTHDETLNGVPTRVIDSTLVPPAAIEEEMYNSGLPQVAIPLADKAEADRIAHSNGADLELQGAYAVIKPKADSKVDKIDTIKGSLVAFQASQSGMSKEEITTNLAKYGYDEQDIANIFARAGVIEQATASGMTIQEVSDKMYGLKPTVTKVEEKPETVMTTSYWSGKTTEKAKQYSTLIEESETMSASELVSSLEVLHPTMVADTLTTIPAFFGNKQAQQRYDKARESSRTRIVAIAKEDYGLDVVWQPNGVAQEGWFVQTETGLVEVTPGIWESLKKGTGEAVGGLAGAIAGAKYGARVGAGAAVIAGQAGPQAALPEEVVTVPLAMSLGGIVGGIFGGITGAIAGSQYDYTFQAMKLQEDMEAEAMAYSALNAFEAAAIGEVIGFGVIKGLGTGWNHIVKAKDYVLGGDDARAYKALKEITFLDDSQINDIVVSVKKHVTLTGNKYSQSVQAVTMTQPGMHNLVNAAAVTQPTVGAATGSSVVARAKQVLKQTESITDEQVPRMLMGDLQNYTTDVKNAYGRVKALATQSPRGLNFEWSFDDLAIQPVLEKLQGKLTDPSTKERFLLQAQRIRAMSESRTFGDLIELRQMTNDFLYNKRVTKADDKDTLRGVINNIDRAIEDGASYVVDNPKEWLSEWAKVRKDYSEMKTVERTALYRSMFAKDGSVRPVQPETIVKALGKYVTALDGSFEDLMAKLPLEGRKRYEGAVVDALTKKFTAGISKGANAIHFPLLSDELAKINFTTPDARAVKSALMDMGETFKNDVALAQTAGHITIPKFQSYLTADPVVRLKFEVASGVFNYVKSKMPGEANRQVALVRATAEMLEKPLNARTFKELRDAVFDDANLSRQLLELQQAAARDKANAKDLGTPRIKVYAGGKLKGSGESVTIPQHRILTIKRAKEIADSEALTLDSTALDAVLKRHGFKAILESSDRVRVLGE